jgi:hypothetical protein
MVKEPVRNDGLLIKNWGIRDKVELGGGAGDKLRGWGSGGYGKEEDERRD